MTMAAQPLSIARKLVNRTSPASSERFNRLSNDLLLRPVGLGNDVENLLAGDRHDVQLLRFGLVQKRRIAQRLLEGAAQRRDAVGRHAGRRHEGTADL